MKKLPSPLSAGLLVITTIMAVAIVAGGVLAAYYVQKNSEIRAFDAASAPSNSSNTPQTIHVAVPAAQATDLNVTTLPAGEGQGSPGTVQGGSAIEAQPSTIPPVPTPLPNPCALSAGGSSSCPTFCRPCEGPLEGASPTILCPMTTNTSQPQIACNPCGYSISPTIACRMY